MLIPDGLGYYRGLGGMQFLFIDIFKGESGWTKVFPVPPTPYTIDSVGSMLENLRKHCDSLVFLYAPNCFEDVVSGG